MDSINRVKEALIQRMSASDIDQFTYWLDDKISFPNGASLEEQIHFCEVEIERIKKNPLYFVMKYCLIKDNLKHEPLDKEMD